MASTIGIDIGSQKTILVADDGEIVRTSTGSVSFPTLIAFLSSSPRNIGDDATAGETIIPMINLLVGKSFDEIQKNEIFQNFKIELASSGLTNHLPELSIRLGDKEEKITTTALLGFYIYKLFERITQVYGDSIRLAFSVPNKSDAHLVKSYYDACSIAGIDLSKISLVESSDSVVASYARKINALKAPERASLEGKNVVLIEVGHVQTTVVVVQVLNDISQSTGITTGVRKLSVEQNNALGSFHFDLQLYEYLSEICEKKHSTKISPGSKRSSRLLSGCERLRKLLSQLPDSSITVENLTDNGDVSFSLKREEFFNLTQKLLDSIKSHINNALASAKSVVGEENFEISYIEILGGGLRMPAVQQLLADIFGQIPLGAKLDDGSVALGAALVTNKFIIDSATKPEETEKYIILSTDVSTDIGLTESELAIARENELTLQKRDNEFKELLSMRNSMESYILEMRSAPKRKFGELIDSNKLTSVLDDSEGWIWDNPDASLVQLSEKNATLRREVDTLCEKFYSAVQEDKLAIEKILDEEAAKAAVEKEGEGEEEDHDNRKLKKADRMRLVTKNKEEGNELFKGGNYRPAAARYHKALSHTAKFFDLSYADEVEVKAIKVTLYLNLASCYIKMENWEQVLRNCDDALALDPVNHKAYFRRSQYHETKKDYEKALSDLKSCQKNMDTEDKGVSQTIDRINKLIKKEKEKEKKTWSKAFK